LTYIACKIWITEYNSLAMSLNVLLISTYEMGRQPFGLASPAAWLHQAGAQVRCLDLSVDRLDAEAVYAADLVAFYLPMHMASRMAAPVITQVRQLNPKAHLCGFGLYAPMNADYLHRLGVETILGGEFESGLVTLAERVANALFAAPPSLSSGQVLPPHSPAPLPPISLARQEFLTPYRAGLPGLAGYAHLVTGQGKHITVGYTEASRGCQHLCRHCPITPVYQGRFRIVQPDVVLADIRQQVAAGAEHITFGDPDFFNGPGHALPLVTALHQEFPHLTYNVTIKVEHLLRHRRYLPTLKETGCLFITSAVESFDHHILTIFDKRHTGADFTAALSLCRQAGLLLAPTFVAFTPWTTLAGYRAFLTEIVRLGLVDQVSPIQYAIRLLIPPGSKLLELPEMLTLMAGLDEAKLSYTWRNSDPRLDALQSDLEILVQRGAGQHLLRRQVFQRVWERAFSGVGDPAGDIPCPQLPLAAQPVPYLSEPWYC
jgi:radical SAM superfamily enzyme YgiQ (UPF0313 family)